MTEPTPYEGRLIAQPDDRVTVLKALLLGVQHVMAMDVYVVPFIIASALALSQADSASLIQSTFLAAGIATIIQTAWCMRMPVAQGPSYIPLGAIIAVALAGGAGLSGMGAVYGALIPGALLVIALGALGWFHRLIRWLVPPIVGGSIILVVGLSLLPIALTANVFAVHGNSTINLNIALAALSATAGMGAYAASKAGVIRLTEALAAELADDGINVNAVLPSIIDTPQNRRDMPDADTRNWVRAPDLARVVLFFLGPDSAAVTGAALPVTQGPRA
ncbi:solute carrier family 23 protein [Acidovorax cavernicola]|uniref:SDR family oxidoreductase n=1 Tax=Acidovorax cavernicola TaxID=1675792 RepID=A0A9X8CYM2_9BURK|nr:solute carrier family 23 protein [Acidovorax cavernicola]RIX72548.1 SDR family oxidoreductase [Acidovorax cavernicola]